jgi:hypothetical protein
LIVYCLCIYFLFFLLTQCFSHTYKLIELTYLVFQKMFKIKRKQVRIVWFNSKNLWLIMGKEKYHFVTNAWIFQNFLRRVKVRGLLLKLTSVNSTQLHTCIIYLKNWSVIINSTIILLNLNIFKSTKIIVLPWLQLTPAWHEQAFSHRFGNWKYFL